MLPVHILAMRYALFAVIATVLNLAAQMATFAVVEGPYALFAALLTGSVVGIVAKYILDKKWIFFDTQTRLAQDGVKFAKYTLMGVLTTAIFWATEILFDTMFESPAMRYLGAVIGLTIGYVTKYHLDRRYVFGVRGAAL